MKANDPMVSLDDAKTLHEEVPEIIKRPETRFNLKRWREQNATHRRMPETEAKGDYGLTKCGQRVLDCWILSKAVEDVFVTCPECK